MATGAVTDLYFDKFDFLPSHNSYRMTFASRIAQLVESHENILLPFSKEFWLAIFVTQIVFSMSFYVTHSMYETSRYFRRKRFHREEKFKINFLLYTMSKVTEPDPLPWFTQKWSTGKLLAFLWTFWGLIIVSCYNSITPDHTIINSFVITVHHVLF